MDAVPIVHIDAVIDVFQHEDHALRQFIRSWNHRMKSTGLLVQIAVVLDVIQQVEPEFVQSQIHDGDAVRHILDVNDLFLQAFQLCLAVLQIALSSGLIRSSSPVEVITVIFMRVSTRDFRLM